MIHLERLSKTYAGAEGLVHALADVTLDVARGRMVVIQGPSGSGKSTLLSIVGGLGSPSSGSVAVAGEDLLAMSPAEKARFRARRIGFVFQMFHLLPYLDVLGNVTVAALPGPRAEVTRRAEDLLARCRLGHRRRHRPAELSAGERQRVAVARAMINQPDLILADEPTGNLDAASAADVLGLLADYRQQGGTVLLVTHDQAAVAGGDEVLWLRDGTLSAA